MGNEFVMLVLSTIAVLFYFFNKAGLEKTQKPFFLGAALVSFMIACVCTTLEDYMLGVILNYTEHLLYFVAMLMFTIWTFHIVSVKEV